MSDHLKHDSPRQAMDGGSASPRWSRPAGNPSYAGYEYQISVTIWAALDLMLAKGMTEALKIEPPSQEDIEAALTEPKKSSLGAVCESEHSELFIQAKTRSAGPWTALALANVLRGNGNGDESRVRMSPLAMLAAQATRRYVFVTNESLQQGLRPHSGEHLLDFPELDVLPPHTRADVDTTVQQSIAPRLLLCAGVTVEVLDARIGRLLTGHGHVPIVKQGACVRDLREAVRRRLTGYAGGRWTRADLLETLFEHGGSVLPTRTMDHYVAPRSYAAICRSLEEHHVVIIAGPSGTGKTLTADIIELALRGGQPPFDVVGEEHGPGYIRGQLTRTDPVLFHLRDPWGGNRLKPGADRWSGELPKLLREAGPGRKFLITSRSDVLRSSGAPLHPELSRHIVTIEVEHYGRDRLADIYNRISSDLSDHALNLATTSRDRALQTLSRPYEIDRFLVALTRETADQPRQIEHILAGSQIDAISRVITEQIAGWDPDGAIGAAIIWALLSARGVLAADVLPKLLRRVRALDPSLRPDVDGLVDFLVAGRNLRKEGNALAFYHPRVEDGLRMAMLRRRGEAEHVLSKIAEALVAWDERDEDWGVETVRNILRAITKLEGIELTLTNPTQARLDDFLEVTALGANGPVDVERAFDDLQRYGSVAHLPSQLARWLMDSKSDAGRHYWRAQPLNTEAASLLKQDPRTQPLLDRFIREVLPFSEIRYDDTIATLLAPLACDLTAPFFAALETIISADRYVPNVDAVVAGVLSGEPADFDGAIERIVRRTSVRNTWLFNEYAPEARRAEEHEVDAAQADMILDEYGYFGLEKATEAVVRRRIETQGLAWILQHPHQELVIDALAGLIADSNRTPYIDELFYVLEVAQGPSRVRAWWAASQHWHPGLNDRLELELLQPELGNRFLQRQLAQNAVIAGLSEPDAAKMLARVAASSPIERRLELVCDLMATQLDSESYRRDARALSRGRAERLANTLPAPQDELSSALCAVLSGEDSENLGRRLSPEAVQLLRAILPQISLSIAGPAACLAAAAGVDPLETAESLLTTDGIEDGEDAVRALLVYGTPETTAILKTASTHGRYHVRRLALSALVERAEVKERVALAIAADDRSAEVRLAWARLMREHLWPEAIESLVRLLRDQRDFSQVERPSWKQCCVARGAAHALGAYEELPSFAVDALLAAATDSVSDDPFIACAALSALASKADPRIPAVLHAAVFSPGLPDEEEYRPVSQAASWAIFERVRAGKPVSTDAKLLAAACENHYEIACPLLMAYGAIGGSEREVLLSKLHTLGLQDRAELALLAAAMTRKLPVHDTSRPRCLLAKVAAGKRLNPTQQEELETWSRLLDPAIEIDRYAIWIASTFNLPVHDPPSDARSLRLPKRVTAITARSSSRVREETASPDNGL